MKSKLRLLTAVMAVLVVAAPSVPAAAAGWENGISSVSVSAPAAPAASASFYQSEVLRLINQQRAGQGLKPLAETAAMDRIASVRAAEAAVRFSHVRPNGTSPASLFTQNGITFSAAGENLGRGYASPESLVAAWMNSAEHRSNILKAPFQSTGIGVYTAPDGTVTVAQLFCAT